jgi:hypothetical protein
MFVDDAIPVSQAALSACADWEKPILSTLTIPD